MKETFSKKKGKGCSVCSTPGHNARTCPQNSARPAREQKVMRAVEPTPAQYQRMVDMRKDGYSAGFIAVDMNLNRSIVAKRLRAEGIVDRSAAADPRYPLRCAKCKKHGHRPSACLDGDALDQLDRNEGYSEKAGRPIKHSISQIDFGRIHLAKDHGIEPESIATNLGIDVSLITDALKYDNYSAYTAA